MACRAHVARTGVVAGSARGEARAALEVRGVNGGTGEAVGRAGARALGASAWLMLGVKVRGFGLGVGVLVGLRLANSEP